MPWTFFALWGGPTRMPRGGTGGLSSVGEPPVGGRRARPRPSTCPAITVPVACGASCACRACRACATNSGTGPNAGRIGTPRRPAVRPRHLAGCAARALLSGRRHPAQPLHMRSRTPAGTAPMRPVPPLGTCGDPARPPIRRPVHACRPAARRPGTAQAADLRHLAHSRPLAMVHPRLSPRTAARTHDPLGSEAP